MMVIFIIVIYSSNNYYVTYEGGYSLCLISETWSVRGIIMWKFTRSFFDLLPAMGWPQKSSDRSNIHRRRLPNKRRTQCALKNQSKDRSLPSSVSRSDTGAPRKAPNIVAIGCWALNIEGNILIGPIHMRKVFCCRRRDGLRSFKTENSYLWNLVASEQFWAKFCGGVKKHSSNTSH